MFVTGSLTLMWLVLLYNQTVQAPPQINWWDNWQVAGGNKSPRLMLLLLLGLYLGIGTSILLPTGISIEEESQRQQKPIVLDLGPSDNFDGEIRPLVRRYNGQARVVGIDVLDEIVVRYEASKAFISPDQYDYIQANFINVGYIKTALVERGYNDCANATYSLWPSPLSKHELSNAVNGLTCPGGQIFIASDNKDLINYLVVQIGGNLRQTTAYCLKNPACSPVGIPFWSDGTYAGDIVYYLLTTK